MGIAQVISTSLLEGYKEFLSLLPSWGQQTVSLFLLIILIVAYCVFIWKFHRFIAHKDIIQLNLAQYNRSEHPVLSKFLGGLLYILEYLVILPFLVFFWFVVFTVFLILLTESGDIKGILIASATIIGAIRMISYLPRYGQSLAKDVAKLLPFTLLAIQIATLGFLDFERILTQIAELPKLFNDVTVYLLFIVFMEVALRAIDLILSAFGLEDDNEKE